MSSQRPGPLLTVRAMVVLMLALLTGVIAGLLSYLSAHDIPASSLVGGGAAAAALVLFHSLLER